MGKSRYGYGVDQEAYTPQEVAELLSDVLRPGDSAGYQAMKIIKWAKRYSLGKHYDISVGRWEFSRQDVDTLRRMIEDDAPYVFTTKDVAELTGLSQTQVLMRARQMKRGRQITDPLIGDPIMFSEDDVKVIQSFVGKQGDFIKQHYAVEGDLLTVTRVAELLQPDFLNHKLESIQDKVRRASRERGIAGTYHEQKNMWLFTDEDVEVIRRDLLTPRPPARRGGRPKKSAAKAKTNLQ